MQTRLLSSSISTTLLRRSICLVRNISNLHGRGFATVDAPSVDEEPRSVQPSHQHLQTAGKAPPKGVIIEQAFEDVLPMLPIPPPYPCKHLSNEEVGTYLQPLYKRGWGIYRQERIVENTPSLWLAKNISFVWHYPLISFLNELNSMAKEENHHPRITYEFRSMEIRIHTHSAYQVNESEQSNGITLRDVRLAFRIEEALNTYRQMGKVAQVPPLFATKLKLQKNRRKAPQPCVICGGDHWTTACPSRFTAKPRVPCSLCGEDHWKFACPEYSGWIKTVKASHSSES